MTTRREAGPPVPARTLVRITCASGIASSLLYVAMNVIAPMRYPGYDVLSQTVSELSAIGAPSRPVWVALGVFYNVLVITFGWGIWASAGRRRLLRIVGALILASGAIGFVWPPMHIRGQGFSLTDTMHIVVSMVWVVLSLLAVGLGSTAFGKRFRAYSIVTILAQLALGTWTGMSGPRVAAGLPTPWVGLVERVNIGVFMVWVVVLAILLLRAEERATSKREDPSRLPRAA